MTIDSSSTKISKRSEKLPIRSTATRDSISVYDRLYKANTASSKVRKEVAPVKSTNILMRENEDPSSKGGTRKSRPTNRRPSTKNPVSKSTDGAVFSRLYAKGTASSRAAMKPKNQH